MRRPRQGSSLQPSQSQQQQQAPASTGSIRIRALWEHSHSHEVRALVGAQVLARLPGAEDPQQALETVRT